MKQTKPDLSVVILSHNTVELTRRCLATVYGSRLAKFTMEVIVADNGSTDASPQMVKCEFPQAILVENQKNLGFAAGNNRGIKKARGRYILLLNSDTEVSSQVLATMLSFLEKNPRVGAATCKLVLPDGSIDPACHRGFPTPWAALTYLLGFEKLFPRSRLFGGYHQGYKDFNTVHEVDVISGAFFLVRREVINQVGLLDEDFFMYAEDIDWCYRIREAGWKIVYNPTVTVLHKKKQSGRANISSRKRVTAEIYFHQYNWLFYQKHYAAKYGPLLTLLVNAFYTVRLYLLEKFAL